MALGGAPLEPAAGGRAERRGDLAAGVELPGEPVVLEQCGGAAERRVSGPRRRVRKRLHRECERRPALVERLQDPVRLRAAEPLQEPDRDRLRALTRQELLRPGRIEAAYVDLLSSVRRIETEPVQT